jgi:hypothetical protein
VETVDQATTARRDAPDWIDDDVTERSPGAEKIVLDRYRLVRRLGGGGFGVVWLAHDLKLDRAVAVKRIPAVDDDVAQRARREGIAAARLQHPAIVALHETGTDDEAAYLVSELVRGTTYAELLRAGALSDRDVVEIGLALCDALAHAHKRGVVHRDVKPPNVLVPDSGDGPPAKLTDFGVARIAGDDALTRTGDVVGTLAYMAPEQAEGQEVGPEADLYALGLCLYEGLAGVNPVRGRGAGATVRRIGQRLPPLGRLRRDLPLELCEALDAAVWPDPEERGTVPELRAALAAALADVGDEPGTIAGAPLEPLAPVGPATGTRPHARALAALLAGVLAGLATALLASPPPLPWWWAAAAAAAAVGLLPRAGWLAGAVAVVVWVAGPEAGRAWLVAAAVAPVPFLLRRAAAPAWSAPAAAPALGLAALAGAFPVLAGQLRRPVHRATLGGLGVWWLLLAEELLGRDLLSGAGGRASVPAASGWEAVQAVATSPALLVAPVWGVAAVVLPVMVRGRVLALDVIGATAWSAGLAAATQGALGGSPRGLVAGAVVAGILAVALRASRPRPDMR